MQLLVKQLYCIMPHMLLIMELPDILILEQLHMLLILELPAHN